jgi:copper chaperone NosL
MARRFPITVGARFGRRQFLAGSLFGATGIAGGCLGADQDTPTPVDLSGTMQCDACGMVIENHPGPNGQVFYRDHRPSGHDNPARFCSLKKCLFPYHLERQQRGWRATAVFVTDYSVVDYTLQEEGQTTYISSHTAPGTFDKAQSCTYVVGSDVQGAMGPDFVPFTDRTDAETFASESGGELLEYGDIDEGVIGR